jgi:hypothetical protein
MPMIVETIESRYTLNPSMLEKYLENKFGKGNFSIIVSLFHYKVVATFDSHRYRTKKKVRNGRYRCRGN